MKLQPRSEDCIKINQRGGKLVTICTPVHNYTEYDYERSLDFMVESSKAYNLFVDTCHLDNTNLEETRYEMVREHFRGDYVLFIDADQSFPPDAMAKLIRWQKPMVGTIIVQRKFPHFPCVGYGSLEEDYCKLMRWPAGALLDVDYVGMGFTLIAREVFEKLPEGNPFQRIPSPRTGNLCSEDVSFCIRVKQAGFPILVDSSIRIGHIGKFEFTPDFFITNHQASAIRILTEERAPKLMEAIEPRVAGWVPGAEPKKEEAEVAEPARAC